MRKCLFFFTVLAYLCSMPTLSAQTMSLEDAIALGLKNNFDITIDRNSASMAANSNSLGNAGMLPKLDLNASMNFANNATKQEFSSGLTVDKNGVLSNSTTAGVYLSWTLFDGLKMFATHQRLQELEIMGELNAKITIENTVEQIINAYYSIVKQKQLINGLKENFAITEERLKLTQKKFDLGMASGLEVYQATIDLNAQHSNLLKQQQGMEELKVQLNALLAQPVDKTLDVQDSIPFAPIANYDDIRTKIETSNNQLMWLQHNQAVSKQMLRETKAQFFPKLNLNANYLFSRNQSQAGFSLLNQNLGLNYGFTASWTIFNGLNTLNQVKNARLQIQNAGLEYKSNKQVIDAQLVNAFRAYTNANQLLSMEEENMGLVKKALQIAMERFRLGTISSLEFKEIQHSMDEALVRLTDARFQVKTTETALLKVGGGLVK